MAARLALTGTENADTGEHKTVQARILYAESIGWTRVYREEAERCRGFDPDDPPAERARGGSLFFDDLLDAKVRELNPRYADGPGALLGRLRLFHPDIYGNRDFVEHLRNRGKFFDHEEERERKRKNVTFALVAESDDVEGVAAIVDRLFSLLDRAARL